MQKYVYICSAGHSGSTLLDMLIGSHSRIASLGEVSQLSKNIALNSQCSCGVEIRDCELWSEVIRRVGSQIQQDLFSNPYRLHLGYPIASTVVDRAHQTAAYLLKRRVMLALQLVKFRYDFPWLVPMLPALRKSATSAVRVFDAVGAVLDVDAVVDSSKSYLNAIQLYKERPDRVRIVLLTRDGRGVLWSNIKRGASRDQSVRDWQNRYKRAIPLLTKHVPIEHRLQIRYEDLTTETATTLQSICRLIQLPFEKDMLNFRRKTHHIVNGNRMRLASSSAIRADVEWMTKLRAKDREFFEQQAGALNRLLGYN